MKSGLIKIQWDNVETFTEEQISYYLFLEGKSIEAISKIRNIDSSIVQKQIIEGKIKYRFLAKSKNIEEFFTVIAKAGKEDRLLVISSLSLQNKNNMIRYIRKNYVDMKAKEKEAAIWILGEMKEKSCIDILSKAAVHKFVNIRRMAVSAMGKIEDISAENVLIRALEDKNPQVVMYAVNSLAKIKSQKAYNKIQVLKDNTDKEYLIRAIERYLESVNI